MWCTGLYDVLILFSMSDVSRSTYPMFLNYLVYCISGLVMFNLSDVLIFLCTDIFYA